MAFMIQGRVMNNGDLEMLNMDCNPGWQGAQKENCCCDGLQRKLDAKIAEMTVLIVQVDEQGKRLKVSERLLTEYENRIDRQCKMIDILRTELDSKGRTKQNEPVWCNLNEDLPGVCNAITRLETINKSPSETSIAEQMQISVTLPEDALYDNRLDLPLSKVPKLSLEDAKEQSLDLAMPCTPPSPCKSFTSVDGENENAFWGKWDQGRLTWESSVTDSAETTDIWEDVQKMMKSLRSHQYTEILYNQSDNDKQDESNEKESDDAKKESENTSLYRDDFDVRNKLIHESILNRERTGTRSVAEIAEKWMSIYKVEWEEALDVVMYSLGRTKTQAIKHLLHIAVDIFEICKNLQGQAKLDPEHQSMSRNEMIKAVQNHLNGIFKNQPLVQKLSHFTKKCVSACKSMLKAKPSTCLKWQMKRGETFETETFRYFTKAGNIIDFVVWPAVVTKSQQTLICKGIAEAME